MLSIILASHNTGRLTAQCLASLLRVTRAMPGTPMEFVLIDDASEPLHRITDLFRDFRRELPAETRVVSLRFHQQQHYNAALAHGLSVAKGDALLFVSHDMMPTAEYVTKLLTVAASNPSIGVVRGTSPHVDGLPQHVVPLPFPIRDFGDLESFARLVSEHGGLEWVEDDLLIGDSMLITRAVIDKIGVFDTRYYGLLGDVDFGLRAQRAGFKTVCAKGAWLWHEGAGAAKEIHAVTPQDPALVAQRQQGMIRAAYVLFREKWDAAMPPEYPGIGHMDFARLRGLPPLSDGGEYQPPLAPDPSVCETRTL